MKVINGIENYITNDKPVYLALGNFDGVHLGHKYLIDATVARAHEQNGIAAALIFEPHPAAVLFPDKAPKLLITQARKTELLEELGLDVLIYTPFTLEIARWSPEQFVTSILINTLRIKEAFVGFNYSFGNRGSGTPELLAELGHKYGIGVNIIPPVTVNGETVSSSLIRQAILAGNISLARAMLGHWPTIEGTVIEGEHRGRLIGFPTANLGVESGLIVPGKGVYSACTVIDGQFFTSVVNIGNKPTFHREYPTSIEAYIINFAGNIYGKQLRLFMLEKIRDEKRFNNVDELIAQIKNDCQQACSISELNPQVPFLRSL
ncbi:MAG: bifunctional riboflavin kinase/FAD synthetase [Syntrophomonadaceae bacterium]|jgi:riboflavin kinase/FMN adenylyltransferase